MINSFNYLSALNLSDISILDIIEGFFKSVEWQSIGAIPSVSIAGYARELSFEEYCNNFSAIKENIADEQNLLSLQKLIVNHVLKDFFIHDEKYNDIRNNGNIMDQYSHSLDLLDSLPGDHWLKVNLTHIIEEINTLNNKLSSCDEDIKVEEKLVLNNDNIFEIFSKYFSSDCRVVSTQRIDTLKLTLIKLLYQNQIWKFLIVI